MTAMWFRVTGRVHGVGFRAFAKQTADELMLEGEVWNSREGSVEGHAQGEKVREFLAALERGPGYVEAVVAEPAEPIEYDGFSITRTR